MNENKQVVIPHSTIKWVGIGVISVMFIAVAAYLAFPLMFGPKPEIILLDGNGGLSGLNYVFNVDIIVKNNGGEGWIRIHVELDNAGRYEKQDQRMFLGAGETKSTTFTFDTNIWGSLTNQTTYTAWTTLD